MYVRDFFSHTTLLSSKAASIVCTKIKSNILAIVSVPQYIGKIEWNAISVKARNKLTPHEGIFIRFSLMTER